MKKVFSAIMVLTLMLIMSMTAFASEIDQSSVSKTSEATITTSIAPTYTVTIPEDVSVDFNATSTNFGSITLDAAQLDPGYAVQVEMNCGGRLKNLADETKAIPYTVNSADGAFTSAQYDTAGESTDLTIDITQEAWNSAYAGSYSDTVTFTVSYTEVQ